jgi:hypothetical protein
MARTGTRISSRTASQEACTVTVAISALVATHRARAALKPYEAARLAGVTEAQYRAVESGRAWPGREAAQAIYEALQIPSHHRAHPHDDTPLDRHISRVLHAYHIPALYADSAGRTIEANVFAQGLLHQGAQPGGSIMRWVLEATNAQSRLANWDDVAAAFASWPDTSPSQAWPHGQLFVWRAAKGPDPVTVCMVTTPRNRPELHQITFVPRSVRPAQSPTHSERELSAWPGPILLDLLKCGVCGLLLTGGGNPTAYSCVTRCLPDVSGAELQLQIAQTVLPRALTSEPHNKVAAARSALLDHVDDVAPGALPDPQRALHLWRHAMSPARRSAILGLFVESIMVYPAKSADGRPGVDLAYTWREPTSGEMRR